LATSQARLPGRAASRPASSPSTSDFFRVDEILRRLAEKDGAAERGVVAAIAAGDLEERRLAAFELAPVPRKMRRGGIGARGEKRHDGGIVAPVAVRAADRIAIDFGDELVLFQSRLHALGDALDDDFGDARGAAREDDFLVGFDGALPVHQRRGVDKGRVGERLFERQIRLGGKVIVFEFEADALAGITMAGQDFCQILHILLAIRLHVVRRHPDGAQRAIAVLRAALPDRVAVMEDHHALVDVE
jgi:hypothetical protein